MTGRNEQKVNASIREDIRKRQAIEDEEDQYGVHAKVKVVKNKGAPPFRRAEFDIIYGEGISKIGEIIDIATDENIISKSGSWFSYNGNKLAQGRENVKAALMANPELTAEIEAKVRAVYNEEKDVKKEPKKEEGTAAEKLEE